MRTPPTNKVYPLAELELWLVLLVALALWTLAYQWPYNHRFDFGGDRVTHLRGYDEPFTRDFNPDPEPGSISCRDLQAQGLSCVPCAGTTPDAECPWWDRNDVDPYRWTQDDASLHMPGLGGGAWLFTLRASGPPVDASTTSRWTDAQSTWPVELQNRPRVYRILVRSSPTGDLNLWFNTPRFNAPGDKRSLGFVAFQAFVEPIGGARIPAVLPLAGMIIALALAYGTVRRLGAGRLATFSVAMLLVLVGMWLLATRRLDLAVALPTIPALAFGGWLLARLGLVLGRRARLPSGWRPMLALVLLAFVIRAGGVLHPYTVFSDLGLNVNNLIPVTNGQLYLKEKLPPRAGGGNAPYPPGGYVLLQPFRLLLPDASRLDDLISVGGALLDALTVGVVWYALRRSYGPTAALFGAALYLVPTPQLKSFSIGEFANIYGQSLALPLLVVLAADAGQLRRNTWLLAVPFMIAMPLLSHLGVSISLGLLLGCLVLLWAVDRRAALPWGRLVAAGTIALVLVGVLYYSAYAGVIGERVSDGGTATGSNPVQIVTSLWRGLRRIDNPLSPLMLLLGAAGTALVGMRAVPGPRRTLRLLLLAYWGGVVLSLAALTVRDQSVRWEQFVYPALCIGGGVALGALWRRGCGGRVLAGAALAWMIWRGLWLWVAQLADYLH